MAISNSLFIRVLGELEFGFALLKISLIIIVNVMSLVIVCGGAPNHEVIGFKYWKGKGTLLHLAYILDCPLYADIVIPSQIREHSCSILVSQGPSGSS